MAVSVNESTPGARDGRVSRTIMWACFAMLFSLTVSARDLRPAHFLDTQPQEHGWTGSRGSVLSNLNEALDMVLQRRQHSGSHGESSTQDSTSTATASIATRTTDTIVSDSATTTSTSLPRPFDTSLGSNFTNSACPNYFNSFLNNATFESCLPVSLLLQNSLSFFQALRSASLLSTTLDAACDAPLAVCSPLMSHIASTLISDDHCGPDYLRENPLVVQAYNGLVAYDPMYQASCLQDSSASTPTYCFLDAFLNASNPADSYPYYTVIGIDLPAGAQPSCSQCLQQSMQIFATYAIRKEQPLASTYLACASQVNMRCGIQFADVAVKAGSAVASSGAAARGRGAVGLEGYGVLLGSFVAAASLWQML